MSTKTSRGLVLLFVFILPAAAQVPRRVQTMRPVIRGVDYAVSTRKPQATQAGEQIVRAGGNAFDAAVAAQAALSVTDPANNGVGSDAFILIYDSQSNKVISINAGGTVENRWRALSATREVRP